MGLFDKIFGTHSEHELKRIYPIVDKIEGMREDMVALSDEELRAKTDEYKRLLRPCVKQRAVCLAWNISVCS